MRLLAFILTLTLSACSAHAELRSDIPVELPYGLTALEKSQVMQALKTHVDVWQGVFFEKTKGFKLVVHRGQYLKVLGPSHTRLLGVYFPVENEIHVAMGEGPHLNSVRAFFHELCHRNAVSDFGYDPLHEDKRWREWNDDSYQLGALIGKINNMEAAKLSPKKWSSSK